MVEAVIIADDIIAEANALNKPINNMKLQKIMFFLNVKYLLDNNTELITYSSFEKWSYGPAIKSVYKLYSSYYGKPIIKILDYKYLTKSDGEYIVRTYRFSKTDLDIATREFIKDNLKLFIDYDAFDLVKKITSRSTMARKILSI